MTTLKTNRGRIVRRIRQQRSQQTENDPPVNIQLAIPTDDFVMMESSGTSSSSSRSRTIPTPTSMPELVSANSEQVQDEIICDLCKKGDREEALLLCDKCERGIHYDCINLSMVPPGDWYCPACRLSQMCNKTQMVSSYQPAKGSGVLVYLRVSSKGQDQPEFGRFGLDTQNDKLLEYVRKNSLRIKGTFEDIGTGMQMIRRSDFQQMLKKIKSGMVILVFSVSRFGRNIQQVQEALIKIHKRGGYVYSLNEKVSSHDEAFLRLVQQAEQESKNLSATLKASIARRRELGCHIGPALYGFEIYYDDNNCRRIRKCSQEQKYIKYICECVDVDRHSFVTTAIMMNTVNQLYRGNKRWTTNLVSRVYYKNYRAYRSAHKSSKTSNSRPHKVTTKRTGNQSRRRNRKGKDEM